MQAPQSSPAAKKHRPSELESESETKSKSKSTGTSKSSGSPASFFAELTAAAAAANAAVAPGSRPVDEAEGRTPRATEPQPGTGGASAALPARTPESGKASRPRSRVAESDDAPHRDAGAVVSPEPAKRLASVTDRRVESRRASDGPASNRPAREWIRPDWMTHERGQEVQRVEGSHSSPAPTERPGLERPPERGSRALPGPDPPSAEPAVPGWRTTPPTCSRP
jgi:hypothetical protein